MMLIVPVLLLLRLTPPFAACGARAVTQTASLDHPRQSKAIHSEKQLRSPVLLQKLDSHVAAAAMSRR